MSLKYYFLSAVCIGLQSYAGADEYYYCHSYPDQRMSAFDRIAKVSGAPGKKTLHTYTRANEPLLKTFNEDKKITAVYKNHFLSPHKSEALLFTIFELDLSKLLLTRFLAYHNMSVQDFETAYQIPFSKKVLAQYNKNPEILKYLPAGLVKKGNFSYAFAKDPMPCRAMGYLSYIKDTVLLALIQILSAG